MKTFKWPIITAVISSIGIFLYLLISKEPITTSSLSDTFFIVSLFFLIIGIALWIMSSGFFDNFQRSMKKWNISYIFHIKIASQNVNFF